MTGICGHLRQPKGVFQKWNVQSYLKTLNKQTNSENRNIPVEISVLQVVLWYNKMLYCTGLYGIII